MVFATYRIIRETNYAFSSLFGYDPGELEGRSFNLLYPRLTDFIKVGELWRTRFAEGGVFADERIMRKRDGIRIWCRVRGRSLADAEPFSRAIYCFDLLPRSVQEPSHKLTSRQQQVLALVCQGKTNAAIAVQLGLSKRSVETHRYRLMHQLGMANSAELVAWFASSSVGIEPPPPTDGSQVQE